MEGDFTSGGEHKIQYTDKVLQNCTSEKLYNFIDQSHPNKFKKFFKNKRKNW